jgi:WD40 repeat protein
MGAELNTNGLEALTATGGAIATAPNDNTWSFGVNVHQSVTVWDSAMQSPRISPALSPGTEAVTAQFTKAGPMALTSRRKDYNEYSKTARIWDLVKGVSVGQELVHDEEITCAHFSPDGLKLATGSEDGMILIWDAWQGVALTPPLNNQGRLRSILFSPDSTKLVATTEQGSALIWDVSTGQRVAGPLTHDAAVWFAQFSPKGVTWPEYASLKARLTNSPAINPMFNRAFTF